MNILVTGSLGLVGWEAVKVFTKQGHKVVGIDNNMRKDFFAGISPKESPDMANYIHCSFDIRNADRVKEVFRQHYFHAIIHAAAQPSHDYSAMEPLEDFEINAFATLNILECARKFTPESPFIFISTSKVYGDSPNKLKLTEEETRFDFFDVSQRFGIDESLSIDQSLHSPFGVSKTSADLLTQEYGRYYNLPTACFRASCLTGPFHQGVSLHGFLSYLIKSTVTQIPYTIFGYQGKQVRDQLHAYDLISAINYFMQSPKVAQVYNIGGGVKNAASVLEVIDKVEKFSGLRTNFSQHHQARKGDHICFYADNRKFQKDYPQWEMKYSLDTIIEEILKLEHGINK